MAVVINEFEVVPQSSPRPAPAPQQGASGEPSTPTPEEIVEQLQRQHLRQLRVRAH